MAQFGDDEVFFGSVPVYLRRVEGKTVVYDGPSAYGPDPVRGKNGKPTRTLLRKDPIPHPDGGAPVVVPCMPCLDQVLLTAASATATTTAAAAAAAAAATTTDAAATTALPEALRKPLVKVAEPFEGAPKAFASGCRSACVKVGDEWYRLKGCGNNDQGFIVKESAQVLEAGKPAVKTRQIRGCAFVHTAICENHKTATLAQKLDPSGVLGTNLAAGYYVYEGKDELPLGSSHPEFRTACIVERTRGDRRLGTHLLAGIAILLPELLDTARLDETALANAFPVEVRSNGGDLGPLGTAWVFEEDGLGVLPAADLFGMLQLFSSEKVMQAPAPPAARDAAWKEISEMIKSYSAAAAADDDDHDVAAEKDVCALRSICAKIISSRLLGGGVARLCDEINASGKGNGKQAAEERGGEEEKISEGMFGAWVDGGYQGDKCRVMAESARSMLLGWLERGAAPEPEKVDLDSFFPRVPSDWLVNTVVANNLLARAERAPEPKILPLQHLRDMKTGKEATKEADVRWASAWADACTKVGERAAGGATAENGEGENRDSVLVYLFSRLGFECGRFLRLLHAERTSWGTYQDAICHPSQWHCNAHANNLVVLAPSTSSSSFPSSSSSASPPSFLSYLDLDMCFSNEDFVEIDPKARGYGSVGQDADTFALRLGFENVNFAEVVAGNDASSGVPPIAKEALRKHHRAVRLAREVLCDVMMRGYLAGYYGEEENGEEGQVVAADSEMHMAAMEIVKLALIKQADYLA